MSRRGDTDKTSVPVFPAVSVSPGLTPAVQSDPDSPVSSGSDHDSPRTDKGPWAPGPPPPSSATVDVDAHHDIPDGGLRAWLVVAGAFIDFTVAFGLLNSFGVFQARYMEKWADKGTAAVTWIGSAQLFVFFVGGLFVGPAFDRYGSRSLLKLGTAICFASFLCTSWSAQYWHYLLSQGFLFGLGNALLFYPVTGAISEWFDEKRGLALGVASAGSSAGGVLWPIVLDKLFDNMSEEAVHRIIAVASTPLLLLSCYLVKERQQAAVKDAKPSQKNMLKVLFEWRFIALCGCLMVMYCGMLVPFYYIPLYAQDQQISSAMANNLLAITYGGSFFGRIGAGWLADCFGRFNILILIGIIMSVVVFCWIWMKALWSMVIFAVLFGLFSAGLVPLGSACVAQTTSDMGFIGRRIGVMMAFCSIGALTGGPISGLLRDGPTSWVAVHSFSAGVTLAGSLLLLGVRFWNRPRALVKF